MRIIDTVIIHCSFTPEKMDIGVDEIRNWHVNDNGWTDIGYHYVIRRSGVIETGRPISIAGAHANGHNKNSVGICMVGGKSNDGGNADNFTHSQYDSLRGLVSFLIDGYPIMNVIGHCDVSDKTCPNFNVADFLSKAGIDV